MKTLKQAFAVVVSWLSIGSIAAAGSLAAGEADPAVEDIMVEEAATSSVGWLPLLAIIAVGALVLSGDDEDPECEIECLPPPT